MPSEGLSTDANEQGTMTDEHIGGIYLQQIPSDSVYIKKNNKNAEDINKIVHGDSS